MRRLDNRVLPRQLGGPARAGDHRTEAEIVLSRFRIMTFIYAFIAVTQLIVIAAEGPASASKAGVLLLVTALLAGAYSGFMWRKAAKG